VAAYKKAKYYATEHDYREYASNGQSFGGAFITQKLEELSGVAIMSTREQATFCKKPFFPYKFSTRRLLPRPKRPRDVPLIVHAPSDRIVKRTDIVLEAVEKLKTRNIPFRFELIENKPNEYVLQRLIDADIVIDQPATQPAKFAVEGLSASCVVFAGNDPVFLGLPEDPFSPVIQFYPDVQKLYEDLIPIVEDKGLRASLMRKSFEFWQDNYSREAFAKAFMRIIEGEQPTVSPWSDNKAMLLRFSDTWRQKMMISIFY
jgi:hypothetical protein